MNGNQRSLSLEGDRLGARRPGILGQRQIRTVFQLLFRLSCWSATVWLVWNHAIAGFLNAPGMNLVESIGTGALLCAASIILEDTEDRWDQGHSRRLLR